MCIYFVRHITASLHLGALDNTSAYVWVHCKQRNQQQTAKKKKAKNTALNKLKKGYVFTAQELKEKGKAFPYIILS